MSADTLKQLFDIIESRKGANGKESYVASLFEKGTSKIAQKVGEEAVETCIEAIHASKGGDKDALASESADLLFHLMVLWADQGLQPDDIMQVLQGRLGTSGHEEKASR